MRFFSHDLAVLCGIVCVPIGCMIAGSLTAYFCAPSTRIRCCFGALAAGFLVASLFFELVPLATENLDNSHSAAILVGITAAAVVVLILDVAEERIAAAHEKTHQRLRAEEEAQRQKHTEQLRYTQRARNFHQPHDGRGAGNTYAHAPWAGASSSWDNSSTAATSAEATPPPSPPTPTATNTAALTDSQEPGIVPEGGKKARGGSSHSPRSQLMTRKHSHDEAQQQPQQQQQRPQGKREQRRNRNGQRGKGLRQSNEDTEQQPLLADTGSMYSTVTINNPPVQYIDQHALEERAQSRVGMQQGDYFPEEEGTEAGAGERLLRRTTSAPPAPHPVSRRRRLPHPSSGNFPLGAAILIALDGVSDGLVIGVTSSLTLTQGLVVSASLAMEMCITGAALSSIFYKRGVQWRVAVPCLVAIPFTMLFGAWLGRAVILALSRSSAIFSGVVAFTIGQITFLATTQLYSDAHQEAKAASSCLARACSAFFFAGILAGFSMEAFPPGGD